MYTISLSFPAKLKRRTIKNPTTTKKANLHIYRWKKRTKPRNTMSSRAVVYAKPQQEEKKKIYRQDFIEKPCFIDKYKSGYFRLNDSLSLQ